ncbi:helix-turn-helix domain-containing protein [Galactobacter sp.]|uniref:helix-turn-helix domain-containing protein n=1 Tax=Galactobacter sp. TaxID=2676125 RepID=UPI00345D47BD
MQSQSNGMGRVEQEVGQQVALLRSQASLTQRQLADKLTDAGMAVDASAVSRIEKGQRALRVSEALILADVLDVDIDYLVSGVESPDRDFRTTRRAADAMMNRLAPSIADWLNALSYAQELVSADPRLLDTLKDEEGPQAADLYLDWVTQRISELEWPAGADIEIAEEDADIRVALRRAGHALVDSVFREPTLIVEGKPVRALDPWECAKSSDG